MPKCNDCQSLMNKTEYYKKGGKEAIHSNCQYYCLLRGLSLSERQKKLGYCDKSEVTYPTVALRLQRIGVK